MAQRRYKQICNLGVCLNADEVYLQEKITKFMRMHRDGLSAWLASTASISICVMNNRYMCIRFSLEGQKINLAFQPAA
jgi:hypothetical protein